MKLVSKKKKLDLSQPKIMGILNVTPDSFSDGGRFNRVDTAILQVERMLSEGADIIDVGGESTRPGAMPVTLEDELERVIPVIEAIHSRFPCWVSIDTSKAQVMQAAVEAGADLVNDVFALQQEGALKTVAALDVPVCLMHMQGIPAQMQNKPEYEDIISDVLDFLNRRIQACIDAGIRREHIILDPGFGFGKTLDDNYLLLSKLDRLLQFKLPLLVGMSRKSMIFKLLDEKPQDVLGGSLACALAAVARGAKIIRVHDVKETAHAMRVMEKIHLINSEQN